MSNKEEFFSVELKVSNRDDPLVQTFLQQFSAAMVREDSIIQGMPEIQVIACGWDPVAGAMTKCDAYEQFIEGDRNLIDQSPENIVHTFLEDEEENMHDR